MRFGAASESISAAKTVPLIRVRNEAVIGVFLLDFLFDSVNIMIPSAPVCCLRRTDRNEHQVRR